MPGLSGYPGAWQSSLTTFIRIVKKNWGTENLERGFLNGAPKTHGTGTAEIRYVRKNASYSSLSGTDLGATVAPARCSVQVTCWDHGGSRKWLPPSPTCDKVPKRPWPPGPPPPSSQQPLRPAPAYGDAHCAQKPRCACAAGWTQQIHKQPYPEFTPPESAHAQSVVALTAFFCWTIFCGEVSVQLSHSVVSESLRPNEACQAPLTITNSQR